MNDKEIAMLKELTKQLEISNKIAMKNLKTNNELETQRINSEIEQNKEKSNMYRNISNVLGLINFICILGSIAVILFLISSLGACASVFN